MSQDLQLNQQNSETTTPKGGATPGGTTFEEYKRAMSGEGNPLQDQTQAMLQESTKEIIKKSNEALRKSKSFCNVYDERKTRAEKLDEALKKADDIMRDSQMEGSRYALNQQGTLKRAGTTMIYNPPNNNLNTLEDMLEISRGRTGGFEKQSLQQNLSSPSSNNFNNTNNNPEDHHQQPVLIDPPLQNVQQRVFHSLSPYASRNPAVSNSVFIPSQSIQPPTLQRTNSFSQSNSLQAQLDLPSWLLEAQNSAFAAIKPVILDNPADTLKTQETKKINQTQPSEILFASFAADFPQSNSAIEGSQKIVNNSENTSNYDVPELGSMDKIVSNYIQKTQQDLRKIRNSELNENQQQLNSNQNNSSENSLITSSISSSQMQQQNQQQSQQYQFLGNDQVVQEHGEQIGNRRGTARFAASSVFFTPNTDNLVQPLKQKPNSQSVYIDNHNTTMNTNAISIIPISQQKYLTEQQPEQQHKLGFQEYISQIHQQLDATDKQGLPAQENATQMNQIIQQNLQQDQIVKHSKILSASTYTPPPVDDFSLTNEKKQFKSVSSSPVNGILNSQQSQLTALQTNITNNLGTNQLSNYNQQQASSLSPQSIQQKVQQPSTFSSANSVNQAQPINPLISNNSSQQQQQTQQSYSLSQDVVSSHIITSSHQPSRQLANSIAVFPSNSMNNPTVTSTDQLLVSRNQNRTFTQPGLNSWQQQQQLGDQQITPGAVGYHHKDLGLGMTHSALYGDQYQAQQQSASLTNNIGIVQPLSEDILAKIGSQPSSFDANTNKQNVSSKDNHQNIQEVINKNVDYHTQQGKLEQPEKEKKSDLIQHKDNQTKKINNSNEHTTHSKDNHGKKNITEDNASQNKLKGVVQEEKTIPKKDSHQESKRKPQVQEVDDQSQEKEKTKSEKRTNPQLTNDKVTTKPDSKSTSDTASISNQNNSKSITEQGKKIDTNKATKNQNNQDQSSKPVSARQSQQKQNTEDKTMSQQKQSINKVAQSKTEQQEDNQELSTKKQKPNRRDISVSSSTYSKDGIGENKHDLIKRNAVQIICFHVWQYVKRQRNKEHRTELVQFIYYCIQTIQKVIRGYLERKSYKRLLLFRESLNAAFAGWKTRRILKMPQLKQIASEIASLQLEKQHVSRLSANKEKNKGEIEDSIYKQKVKYSNSILALSLGSRWIAAYKQHLSSQGQNKIGSPQRLLKSPQKVTSPSPQVQRKTKDTEGVKTTDEEKKKQPVIKNTNKDAWDDIPVGSKTTKKNEKMTGWEDAYPPEANLDSKQKEFIESHKNKQKLEDKKENKSKEEKEDTPQERPKNAWDDIPVGGHQKKGMEKELNEFPTGDTPKRQRKESSSNKKSSRKKKTLQDETKTQEQKEALQRRTKYDPRKAVEQAKQASQTEVDEKQKVVEEDGDKEESLKKSKKNRKQSSNQVESEQNEQDQRSQSKGKRDTVNTDESEGEDDKANLNKHKQSGDDGETKKTVSEKDGDNKNNTGRSSSGESHNEDNDEDDKDKKTNQGRSVNTHKSFLRRKQHSPVFETLNWKNIKSRTDTGRNDLTQSQTLAIQSEKLHEKNIQLQQQQKFEQAKQQQKMPKKGNNNSNNANNMMKQLSEKNLSTQKSNDKKKAMPKQGVGEVYYSELNYVDEDEDFWTSKKQATPAPFKLYGSNKHNVFSKIPTQAQNAPKIQYPVAPKLFTEYLPNKQSHKAIHQLSPTQPSQQIILSTSMNNQLPSQQNSSTNIRDSGYRVSAMNSNQNIPANVAVFLPTKMKDQQNAKLSTQAGPLMSTGGGLNMAERRQHQKENKLSSIQQHLQQQQQQLQQQQLQQQEDIDLQQLKNIQSQLQQQTQQNQDGKIFSQSGSSAQIPNQAQTSATAAPQGLQESRLNMRQQEIPQHKQIQKRSEEDSREIQMRSFQQQQIQHKQNFVFPPTLFKQK